MAAAPAKQSYSTDPALYIYTSLTAGSSHIVTATSRLETILKANRVPFKAIDLATDEKARMLWGRRAGKDEGGRMRKLPGLVQMGLVLGDLVEIEDWNEYGELKQHVKIYYDEFTIPAKGAAQIPNPLKKPIYGNSVAASASKPAASSSTSTTPKPIPAAPPLPGKKANNSATNKTEGSKKSGVAAVVAPVKSIAEEAAQKAKQVRLDTLRKAVQSDKDKAAAAAASKDAASNEKKTPTSTAKPAAAATTTATATTTTTTTTAKEIPADSGASATGLQSPTSGRWATNPIEDSLGNVLQSPTSGTWKSGGSDVSLPIREHRGSSVVEASKEEIAAIEKSEAIPEAAIEESDDEEEEEEDDSDDEDEDKDDSEDEEEQPKKAAKK